MRQYTIVGKMSGPAWIITRPGEGRIADKVAYRFPTMKLATLATQGHTHPYAWAVKCSPEDVSREWREMTDDGWNQDPTDSSSWYWKNWE